jgi:putative transposase
MVLVRYFSIISRVSRSLASGGLLRYYVFMSIRETPIVNSEYYHIFNRGNGKNKIFLDNEDYLRFIKLLYLCNSNKSINFRTDIVEKKISAWDFERGDTLVSIGAWVLMPNHFHIYLTGSRSKASGRISGRKNNSIIIFLQKLSTAYAKYFNAKYKRTGSLFEGKFKSVNIKGDIQAKYLFSYIHLNPIKLIQSNWKENGIKNIQKTFDFLDSYKWSSFHFFKGKKLLENVIINIKDFPDYFKTVKSFNEEILEWFSDGLPEALLLEDQKELLR